MLWWLITASEIINISDGCLKSEITLSNAKLRFQMRNYAFKCEITLSNAKLRFRMRNYAFECEITLSNAKLRFQMRNYAIECEIMLSNAKLRFQLADLKIDQSNPHFVHSLAFTKRHLSGEKNRICYYTI